MTPRLLAITSHLLQSPTTDVYEGQWGEQPVWIKVLRPDTPDARLRDEAYLLRRLRHPGLPTGHGWISLAGVGAALMAGPEAIPLAALQRRPSLAVALAIVAQVAEILVALRDVTLPGEAAPLRLIHRGLTPEHVWLAQDGQALLFDLLTAKVTFSSREALSSFLPLGALSAPRTDRGEPQTDTYGLGALLFALLTGETLPPHQTDERAHLEAIDHRLAAAGLEPAVVRPILHPCLRHRPADRRLLDAQARVLWAAAGGERAALLAVQAHAQRTVPPLRAAMRYRGQLRGGLVGSHWTALPDDQTYQRAAPPPPDIHTADTMILPLHPPALPASGGPTPSTRPNPAPPPAQPLSWLWQWYTLRRRP